MFLQIFHGSKTVKYVIKNGQKLARPDRIFFSDFFDPKNRIQNWDLDKK